jgi:DNA modification methylase
MGSGMLPAGAYVTYEHEYILIFRKGGKRIFSSEDQVARRESAFFWEERNQWFSDIWEGLQGVGQANEMQASRERSAAFPFELAYRIINMYSITGDLVLDPFAGTGTSIAAAVAAGRSSIGVDIDPGFADQMQRSLRAGLKLGQQRFDERLEAHSRFVAKRVESGKSVKHQNRYHSIPVMSKQEVELRLRRPRSIQTEGDEVTVSYD